MDGTYALDANGFVVSDLSSTKKWCGDEMDQQEDRLWTFDVHAEWITMSPG